MIVYDLTGRQQSKKWLAQHYGPVFTQGRSDTYRVAELREAEGEPTLTVTVPGDMIPIECYFFGYEIGMLTAHHGPDGVVTFPLPREFTYKLAGQGTHWLNIGGLRLIGLGVPEGPGAGNWRHLNVVLEKNTLIEEE